MEPFERIRELAHFWPYIPPLLAMLAGAIISFIAYLNHRRRTASCLGTIGFTFLFVTNVLIMLLRLAVARPVLRAILGVLLILLNTVAIILLIAAVLMQERQASANRETAG